MASVRKTLAAASLAFLVGFAGYAPRSLAVLIATGTGTQNTTVPLSPPTPGWFNLGKVSLGGGVYIGNGWVITAHHLDPVTNHTITFYPTDTFPTGGVPVDLDPLSAVRLQTPTGGNADIDLIHVAGTQTAAANSVLASLQQLNLSTATPTPGTAITLAGIGALRGPAAQYLVTGPPNNPTWTEVASGGNEFGYKYDATDNAPTAKRWGTNNTTAFASGTTELVTNSNNISVTRVFGADFTDPSLGATTSEAIGISHDSGGPVFSTDSPNTLLGIMLYQETFIANQPAGTAIYGNFTDAGDIATYFNQIHQVTGVPEPSGALAVIAGVGMLVRRRRL